MEISRHQMAAKRLEGILDTDTGYAYEQYNVTRTKISFVFISKLLFIN